MRTLSRFGLYTLGCLAIAVVLTACGGGSGSSSGSVSHDTHSFSFGPPQAKGASVPAVPSTSSTNGPTFDTQSLPEGVRDQAYHGEIKVSGGVTPYRWQLLSGVLPQGFRAAVSSGVATLFGAPTTDGDYPISVQVTDANDDVAVANFNIRIHPPVSITTVDFPRAMVGRAYSGSATAADGLKPYVWGVDSGSVPAGLAPRGQDASAYLEGTPTTAGTFDAVGRVTGDAGSTATFNFSITVDTALEFSSVDFGDSVLNRPYLGSITATGGTPPYTWGVSSGTVPPGLAPQIFGATASLDGIPTAVGVFEFVAKVTDANGWVLEQPVALRVKPPTTFMAHRFPEGAAGATYKGSLSAGGGIAPYSWQLVSGTLPPGLDISFEHGTAWFTGTPTLDGSYGFTARVTDTTGSIHTEDFQIVIHPAGTVLTAPEPLLWTYAGLPSEDYDLADSITNFMLLFSNKPNFAADAADAIQRGKKVIVGVHQTLFVNNNGVSSLRADYQTRLSDFVTANQALLNSGDVVCIYMADEPLWIGITEDEFETAHTYVKQLIPHLPTVLVYAVPGLDRVTREIPCDWVSFDRYKVYPTEEQVYRDTHALMKYWMKPDAKLFLIGEVWWTVHHPKLGWVREDMSDVAEDYLKLYEMDEDVVGIAWFGWQFLNSEGMKDMPQSVWDTHQSLFDQYGK